MAIRKCRRGGPCKVPVPLVPEWGTSIPGGFTFYAEFTGPDGNDDCTLKTREGATQSHDGTTVYLDVDVPPDTPLGVYNATRFEMRYDAGSIHRVKEEDPVNDISLPSIEIEEAADPEIPWPKVARPR